MPLIQLNFNNPLNTSVQIGDVAYFSNPTPVGNFQQWTATSTPHLTNDQQDIVKIGVITDIIPWDGATSIIECNMPSVLFNKYFMQIVQYPCTTVLNFTGCSGDCCNYIDALPQTSVISHLASSGQPTGSAAQEFFFSNPTYLLTDYMFHVVDPNFNGTMGLAAGASLCEIMTSDANYVNGAQNYWGHYNQITVVDTSSGNFSSYNNAGDALNYLISQYPSNFIAGMGYQQVIDAAYNNNSPMLASVGIAMLPVSGSLPSTTTCIPASFIMFSKDNKVNTSSMLGYYASAEFRNNSPTTSELFDVGADVFVSSK